MKIKNSFWEKILDLVDPLRIFYSEELVEIIYTPIECKLDFVYRDESTKSKEIDLVMADKVLLLWDSVEKKSSEVKNQKAIFLVTNGANVFGHVGKVSGKTIAHLSPFMKRVNTWRDDFFTRKKLSVPADPLF